MPRKTAIYFGWTPTGKRIHLGDAVAYNESARVNVVDTFCGATMRAWQDGSMPPAGRVREFCRNCFRSLAWDAFERATLAEVGLQEVPA